MLVANELLSQFLRGEFATGIAGRTVETNAPKDLRVVAAENEGFTPDTIVLYCESLDFDVVEEGGLIPDFRPTYTVTTP